MRTIISLYTGVGGLDYGFEAAGFSTRVALELDPVACRNLRLNRPWPLLEGDIHKFASREILEAACLNVGETDLLIGGPPCQPFSKSAYWVTGDAKRLDDPRSDTLTAYLRVLRDTLPKAFLLENVHGLIFKNKDEGLRHLLAGIEAINRATGTVYRVSWRVLNASHFGVPQLRERVFLVGSREGLPFSFPQPTHGTTTDRKLHTDRKPLKTTWDAIGDLVTNPNEHGLKVGGKWGDLLPTIPEGQNYLWHTNRGGGERIFGWRTRYWSFLLKLAKDQPSWTIQAQPGSAIGPFHWTNRRLSTRELCRLQTIPDDVALDCRRGDAQRMLGNAVPSLMAEVLGREIRSQLFGDNLGSSSLKLLPPVRGPAPAPDRPTSLPLKYRSMIDEHADHPGERRGKRASSAPSFSFSRPVASLTDRGSSQSNVPPKPYDTV